MSSLARSGGAATEFCLFKRLRGRENNCKKTIKNQDYLHLPIAKPLYFAVYYEVG